MDDSPCRFVLRRRISTGVAVCCNTTVPVIFCLNKYSKVFVGDCIVEDIPADLKLKTGKTVSVLGGIDIKTQ